MKKMICTLKSWRKSSKCWTLISRILFSKLGALLLGNALGWTLKSYVLVDSYVVPYISYPGDLYLRVLKVDSVALIVTSVIMGASSLSVHSSRKISLHTAAYIVCTTLMAVMIGITLAVEIHPGNSFSGMERAEIGDNSSTADSLMDLVRNMVPSNLFQFSTGKTEINSEDYVDSRMMTNVTDHLKQGHYVNGINTMGLIVWSFVFGVIFNKMGEKGKIVIEVVTVMNEAITAKMNLIMGYLPVGVMFMIASLVLEIDEWEIVFKLGMFIVVVITGLLIHAVIVLPLIYFIFTRRSPMAVIRGVLPALMTALAISSSSATLPVTLRCCEEELKIDQRITRFILPIGTSLNLNGSAIYEVVAAIFIAQLNKMKLNIAHLITVAVTAAVASIGAAGLPATGAVTTLFVFEAVGLPAKEAFTLVVVEWLLDRCNTVINVMGNCYGASLIYRVSTQELQLMTRSDATNLENVSRLGPGNDVFDEDVYMDTFEDLSCELAPIEQISSSAQDCNV